MALNFLIRMLTIELIYGIEFRFDVICKPIIILNQEQAFFVCFIFDFSATFYLDANNLQSTYYEIKSRVMFLQTIHVI